MLCVLPAVAAPAAVATSLSSFGRGIAPSTWKMCRPLRLDRFKQSSPVLVAAGPAASFVDCQPTFAEVPTLLAAAVDASSALQTSSSSARAYFSILSNNFSTMWMGFRAILFAMGPTLSPHLAVLMMVLSMTPFSWHLTSVNLLKKLS